MLGYVNKSRWANAAAHRRKARRAISLPVKSIPTTTSPHRKREGERERERERERGESERDRQTETDRERLINIISLFHQVRGNIITLFETSVQLCSVEHAV